MSRCTIKEVSNARGIGESTRCSWQKKGSSHKGRVVCDNVYVDANNIDDYSSAVCDANVNIVSEEKL